MWFYNVDIQTDVGNTIYQSGISYLLLLLFKEYKIVAKKFMSCLRISSTAYI